MKIIYEINPPKIFYNHQMFYYSLLDKEISKFIQRTKDVLKYTDYIHITDSVLGIPRISSTQAVQILASHNLKRKNIDDNFCKSEESQLLVPSEKRTEIATNDDKENRKNTQKYEKNIKISCSIRNRDRNINSIIQIVTESIYLKITDLLFIMGDMPNYEDANNQKFLSKPTETIKILNQSGFNKYINLNLSVSNRVTEEKKIEKKIKSKPYAMVTQTISSFNEINHLVEILKPHSIKLIPCIMVPSEKNLKAAKMIGLDWEEYSKDFYNFLFDVEKITDTILLTSPNDFQSGIDILKRVIK